MTSKKSGKGSTQPAAVVKITTPQSVTVKNSMPKKGIPPKIVGTANGKKK